MARCARAKRYKLNTERKISELSLKKRSASLLLSLAMLCTLLVPAASAANGAWSGSGTQDDPYLIEDAADLTALADNVNNGTSKYSGKYFKLTEDIEVTGWNPIGYSTSCYFSGDFDGDGHTITINGVDLTANSTQSSNYYGLFGYFNYSGSGSAMSYAKIHDLTVDGAYDVSSKTVTVYAGGIVGYSTGCVIANCVSTVNITASGTSNKGYAGGIAGYTTSVYTYLYNCYSSGTLSAWRTGGIVGHANSGKINYCFTETEPAFGADYGTKTGCYTAAEWAALSDAEKNAWVDAANASVSDYTSVDNFWSTDSDGNPVHVTCDHQHADDDLGVVTEPTCTDRGYTTYTCILCGNSYKDEYTDALGHDLSTETVDPTCTEPGSVTEICTRGDYTNTVELPALGHTPKEGTEVEYETYYEYTCDRCGETYTVFKDERLQAMTITGVNVTLSTDGTYEWEYDAAGNRLRSTNYDVNNTTSQTTITMSADSAFTVGFDYAVSSETNYDKLTITLDSTTVASAVSGTKSDSYASGELAAGTHTLVVKYVKDGSSKGGDDRGYLSNLVIAAVCPHINKSNVQHQDATCTENGYDSFHCDDCGADIYTEIEALGHVWDEGVVTTEPELHRGGRKDLHLRLYPRGLLWGCGRDQDRARSMRWGTTMWTAIAPAAARRRSPSKR